MDALRGLIEIAQCASPDWHIVIENADEIHIAKDTTTVSCSQVFEQYLRAQPNDRTEKKALRLAFSEHGLQVFNDRKLQEIITGIARIALDNPEPQEIVSALIQQATNVENAARDQSVVLLIGGTGTGKTTAINYWQGCRMRSVRVKDLGLTGKDRIYAEDQVAEIGHLRYASKTKIPHAYSHTGLGLTFVDCPGFRDTSGAHAEICNAFAIRSAFEQARDVRLAVFISAATLMITAGREGARNDLWYLQQLLITFSPFQENIIFVITSAEDCDEENVRESFIELLEAIKNDDEVEDLRKFCNEIYNFPKRQILFCKPLEADSLPDQLTCIQELPSLPQANRVLGYPLSNETKTNLLDKRPEILVQARAAFTELCTGTVVQWNLEAVQTEGVDLLKQLFDRKRNTIDNLSIDALILEEQNLRTSVNYCDRIDTILARNLVAREELQDQFIDMSARLEVVTNLIWSKFLDALFVASKNACQTAVEAHEMQRALDTFKENHAHELEGLDAMDAGALYAFIRQFATLPHPDYHNELIGYLGLNVNEQNSLKDLIRNNIIVPFEINLVQRTHIITANGLRLALAQTLRTIENVLRGLQEGDCIRINSVANQFVLYFDTDLLRDRFHGVSLEVQRTGCVMGNYTVDLMTNRRVAGYAHLKFGALQGQGNINNLRLTLAQNEALIQNYSKTWDKICATLRLR